MLFCVVAMGPILPFLPVYGKQLGVSTLVMGSITAILPILFLIAKPIFGFLVDYFYSWRKTIFIILLGATSISYICLYFLPVLPGPILPDHSFNNISCTSLSYCSSEVHFSFITNLNLKFCMYRSLYSFYIYNVQIMLLNLFKNISRADSCSDTKKTICHWTCTDKNFSVPIQFQAVKGEASFSLNTTCLPDKNASSYCFAYANCNVTCDNFEDKYCLYTSLTFWMFIILMSLGNIGFNVGNSISDAICFDILGIA